MSKKIEEAHEVWVSTLHPNLRLTVVATDGDVRKVLVDRRRVDKTSGEVLVEQHEREVPAGLWGSFTRSYRRA